ncbi:MAG: hypothetical protein M3391_10455 [Actinomycetota bacterium]|nr:hypothetical protein [Actinomycetota bacterium]
MLEEVKRLALFTSGVAELTRNRAEQIVKSWTGGDVPNARASTMVKQLVDTSRQNRSELLSLIRSEMRNQARTLGLADGREVERLERRVDRLEEELKRARSGSESSGKKTSKTTARKGGSKKTAKKSGKKSAKKTSVTRKKTTTRGASVASSERTPAPGSPGRPLGRS